MLIGSYLPKRFFTLYGFILYIVVYLKRFLTHHGSLLYMVLYLTWFFTLHGFSSDMFRYPIWFFTFRGFSPDVFLYPIYGSLPDISLPYIIVNLPYIPAWWRWAPSDRYPPPAAPGGDGGGSQSGKIGCGQAGQTKEGPGDLLAKLAPVKEIQCVYRTYDIISKIVVWYLEFYYLNIYTVIIHFELKTRTIKPKYQLFLVHKMYICTNNIVLIKLMF